MAIAYDYLGQTGDDLDALRNVTAFGGHGSVSWGGAGTVVLRRHDQTFGDLYVDDNVAGATSGAWTPLPHVGFGAVRAVSADTLATDGTVTMLPGGLVGMEINPNVNQAQTFIVSDNTTTTLTVDVSGGLTLTNVATASNTYVGIHRFDNVFFRRGGFLVSGDKVVVGDTVRIEEYGQWTHFDATAAFESRLDLQVGTLVVASNGSINADGRGYLGGNRPGNVGYVEGRTLGNALGSAIQAGGSYGGRGAHADVGQPNPLYGNLTQPVALGSGGGIGSNQGWPGADGGGWLQIQAGSIQLDGALSVNGQTPAGANAGSGSGGTVDLETGTLAGNGFIRANGGGFEVGGGGGRVAIRYGNLALDSGHVEARAGQGSVMSAGNGTIFLKQSHQAYGDLIVDGHAAATPADLCFIPGGYTFDNIVLRNRAYVTADDGLVAAQAVSLLNQSTLTHSLAREAGLAVTAPRVEVDATSAIDVSGRGYLGSYQPGNVGYLEGRTLGNALGAPAHAGGSYGGLGHNAPVSLVYGDPLNPTGLGGGGGRGSNDGWPGANGGGRIRISASNVVVHGAILANGNVPRGANAGSGAGGAIWIDTASLRGTGVVAADGGAFEVGGGGGRVAIAYDALGASGDDLNGLRNVTAFGGHGSVGWGSAGTVVLRGPGQTYGDLFVDDNVVTSSSSVWTPLPLVGFGRIRALTADTLTPDGSTTYLPGALVGLWLNPDTSQAQVFRIVANTESNLIVDLPGATTLLDVAATGDECAALHRFDNVHFRRGGFLVCGDWLRVGGAVNLAEYGRLTHFDATATFESRLELQAGALRLATNGFVDVNGRGYLGGRRGNNAMDAGRTLFNQIGAAQHKGGSHGGLGAGTALSAAYGDVVRPVALGSGGGIGSNTGWPGGDGGGWAHLAVATAIVDGVISADGAVPPGANAGSGAGGTIFLEAGHVEGTGSISVNGGAFEVGGGGGRIAIHYATLGGSGRDFNDLRSLTAFGGHGSASWGSAGTVLLKQSAQAYGDLYVDDGMSGSTALNWTPLPHVGFGAVQAVSAETLQLDGTVDLLPGGLVGNLLLPDRGSNRFATIVANTATSLTVAAGTDLTALTADGRKYAGLHRFDNLYFRRGGSLVSGDRLAVAGTLRIAEYGVLTHPDATAEFESALDVLAGALVVETNGAIDVTARGYLGGRRPGNAGNSEGRTLGNALGSTMHAGGSYGGLGGASSGGVPNPLYGSSNAPVELGSGGGQGSNSGWPGGDGGGRVAIWAGNMQIDGTIAADGGQPPGASAGSGSGGSVYIRTGALTGQGAIRANGGGFEVGGGGGRIAVHYAGASSVTNSLSFGAAANAASVASGQAGTVFCNGAYVYLPFSFSSADAGGSGISPFNLFITSLVRNPGGGAKVGWSDSVPRRAAPATYVVEFGPDLLSRTNWIPLPGTVSGGEWQGHLPAGAQRGFIRIRRTP